MSQLYEESMHLHHFLREYKSGVANAITSERLSVIFVCTGAEIRRMVGHLRSVGVPICSGHQGYWYAESVEDVEQTISMYESRISKMVEAVGGLRVAKRAMSVKVRQDRAQG